MRFYGKLIALLFSLLFANCPPVPRAEAAVPVERPLAFVRVNVIAVTGEAVLREQTVVVRKGRIARLGPAATRVASVATGIYRTPSRHGST